MDDKENIHNVNNSFLINFYEQIIQNDMENLPEENTQQESKYILKRIY